VRRFRTIRRIVVASISIILGMWLERFVIIVPSLTRQRLPVEQAFYIPTWVCGPSWRAVFPYSCSFILFLQKFFPLFLSGRLEKAGRRRSKQFRRELSPTFQRKKRWIVKYHDDCPKDPIDRLGRKMKQGKVYMVGAGPGDPGLMTVKGLNCIRQAEVVIYDRLVDESILNEACPHAEKIYVGKASNHHTLEQEKINHLLIQKARASASRRLGRGG